jgi:hypothetical protein
MKKNLFFILFIISNLFSQGWKNIITTPVNEPNLIKMDLFTNKDGNHIVVQNSNSLVYYLLNCDGNITRSSTIENSSNVEFPVISGDNNIIYITYKFGNVIKTKYSTNAGISWGNANDITLLSNNPCNGIDIAFYGKSLHLVYALRDSDPYFETYYYRLDSSKKWVDFKNVTDYPGLVGGFPTLSVDNNRLIVTVNTGTLIDPVGNSAQEITRAKDLNTNTWLDPQPVTFNNETSARGKVQFLNDYIFNIYYEFWYDLGQWGYYLIAKQKPDLFSNWSGHTKINYYSSDPRMLVGVDKTANNKLNVIFNEVGNLYHRYFDGISWSSSFQIDDGSISLKQFSSSSVSNDLFVVWKENQTSQLKFRQYDDAPLPPKNIIATKSQANHPLLTWSSDEPDIAYYKIYKYVSNDIGWQFLAQTQNKYYEDITETIITGPAQANEHNVQYKIKAVDKNFYESDFSSIISVRVKGQPLEKLSNNENITDYFLYDSYPNPFNSTTKIRYYLPQTSYLTLKIYNSIGEEVAVLESGIKEIGEHIVDFNSDIYGLKSGVYFYELKAKNFSKIKKLLLIK